MEDGKGAIENGLNAQHRSYLNNDPVATSHECEVDILIDLPNDPMNLVSVICGDRVGSGSLS